MQKMTNWHRLIDSDDKWCYYGNHSVAKETCSPVV